jgi:hypothetical protein
MEPDPNAGAPRLVLVLWLVVFVLAFLLALSLLAPTR